jgi:hypothetical protein
MVMEQFLAELEQVRWFENLGKPIGPEMGVDQIHDWEEWPGPEDPATDEMTLRQQALIDELLAAAGGRSQEVEQLWERIRGMVFRKAIPKVPYDPEEDCYHPQSLSVWWAAWTAGLVGASLFLERPVPPELAEQWKWYLAGHWPCAWVGDYPEGRLMVY